MNTIKDSQSTPPAYWFGVIEHNLHSRMRAELADLGLRRGSWRILHTLADGPASAEDIQTQLPPARKGSGRRHGFGPHGFGRGFGPRFGRGFDRERFGRFATDEERAAFIERMRAHGDHPHDGSRHDEEHVHGEHPHGRRHHGDHPQGERHHGEHPHGERHHEHGDRDHRDHRRAHRIHAVLGDFAERGWITFDDGVAILTDKGRAAHDAAFDRIRDLRASVAAGITEADYATTMATLEAMARNLGWSDKGTSADDATAASDSPS